MAFQNPFVSSEVEKPATSEAQGVSTSLDTNGYFLACFNEKLSAALPCPVVRRP